MHAKTLDSAACNCRPGIDKANCCNIVILPAPVLPGVALASFLPVPDCLKCIRRNRPSHKCQYNSFDSSLPLVVALTVFGTEIMDPVSIEIYKTRILHGLAMQSHRLKA